MGHRCTAVTVVYEGDLPLLRLQARSLAVHAGPGVLDAVVVVDNTRWGLPRRTVRSLVREYGVLAPLVAVVPADRLVGPPADRGAVQGWWGQQVLKVAVASLVTTDRYLVLDAKNVLVNPLARDFLEVPDGRPRMRVQGYADHPLRPRLERSLEWWGVDPAPCVASFGSTITPFVMETDLVRQMALDVEERSGKTFAQAFLGQGLTEFFLYMGWIVSRGALGDVYDLDRVRCPAVWAGRAGVEVLREEVAEAERERPPFFTVHQRALAGFDAERTTVLAAFWARSGLFATVEEAVGLIEGFQRSWRRQTSRRTRALSWVRELPARTARRVGRSRRRPGPAPGPGVVQGGP